MAAECAVTAAMGAGDYRAKPYRDHGETGSALFRVVPGIRGLGVHKPLGIRLAVILDGTLLPIDRIAADRRGAGGTVRVPCWGRWANLSAGQQAANRSHTRIRAVGEQANTALKGWRLLRKPRCSTTRITSLVKAVTVLHNVTRTGS